MRVFWGVETMNDEEARKALYYYMHNAPYWTVNPILSEITKAFLSGFLLTQLLIIYEENDRKSFITSDKYFMERFYFKKLELKRELKNLISLNFISINKIPGSLDYECIPNIHLIAKEARSYLEKK